MKCPTCPDYRADRSRNTTRRKPWLSDIFD